MPRRARTISAHLTFLSLFVSIPASVDMVRQSLAGKSDKWFHWLVVSSVVVGVGVFLEAPEATIVLKRWWALRRGKEVIPENEKSWAIPASYLGLLLVVVGVAGEGIFEFLASNADTKIRQYDEQILTDATLKAGSAKDSSEAAAVAAGHAEDASGKAADTSAKATASASSALSLAAGARKEADSFEKDIVSAKQQAARAEEKLADRSLTDQQQKVISDGLNKFPGQEYKVVAYWDSQESLGIANRIHQSLQMAHWTYLPPPSTGVALMGGIVGIQVWHHPDAAETTKEAAKLLVDSLNNEGILAYEKVENPTNNPQHNIINLSVGSKR
jgi:hypothetical protein